MFTARGKASRAAGCDKARCSRRSCSLTASGSSNHTRGRLSSGSAKVVQRQLEAKAPVAVHAALQAQQIDFSVFDNFQRQL